MNFKKTILFGAMTLATLTAFNTAQAMFSEDAGQEPMSPRTQGYHVGVDIYLSQFNENGSTTRRFLRDTNKALGAKAVQVPTDLGTNDAAFTQFKQAIAGAVHTLDRVAVRDFIRKANTTISALRQKDDTGKAGTYQPISLVEITPPASASASSARMLPRTHDFSTSAAASSSRPSILGLEVERDLLYIPYYFDEPEDPEEAKQYWIYKTAITATFDESETTLREAIGEQYARDTRRAAAQAWEEVSTRTLALLEESSTENVLPAVKKILRNRRYRGPYADDRPFQIICDRIQNFLRTKQSDQRMTHAQRTLFQRAIDEIGAFVASLPENPYPPRPKNIIDRHFSGQEASTLHQLAERAFIERKHFEERRKGPTQEDSRPWRVIEEEMIYGERSAWHAFIGQIIEYLPKYTSKQALAFYLDFEHLLELGLPWSDPATIRMITKLKQTLRTLAQ